ncbi:MAG: sigma-70 family RNA polymerase sigma factor [Planctomycetales bacterium]|nr:sigma-70 family RNA polymerase sigma factor [Planctomycetales bacterium]
MLLAAVDYSEDTGEAGQTSAELFALIYDELCKLAQHRMRFERSDHTLDPTALVHEVYLRLVSPDECRQWDNQGHFFSAAARVMRQVLVDSARRKNAQKRLKRSCDSTSAPEEADDNFDDRSLLELVAALSQLQRIDPVRAKLVELKFFAGLNAQQICTTLGISRATAHRYWCQARAWLFLRISESH